MPAIEVSACATVPAPPERVYAVLADYADGHPRILPKRAFRDLVVEEGGRGAGTVIRFDMTVGGGRRAIRSRITEPEPGRVLAEEDLATGAVTTFVVDPAPEGSRVTITTRWVSHGIRGWIERILAPRLLRPVYAAELALLRQVAQGR